MENQELNLSLLEELESEYGRLGNGYVIDSDSKADWALQKLASKKEEYERIEKIAKEQIECIKAKMEKRKKTYESDKNFFMNALQEYFNTVDHKQTKTQESYKLLSGSLFKKFAKEQMNHDDKVLLNYLKKENLNDFIKTKESVNWDKFKKELTIKKENFEDEDTGEIIEKLYVVDADGKRVSGVTAEKVEGKFDVKF